MENPKADKNKLSILKQSELSDRIMQKRDLGELSNALLHYLIEGDQSFYLQDKGKIDSDILLATLKEVMQYECDFHYSGTLTTDTVSAALKKVITPNQDRKKHPYYKSCNVVLQPKQEVYFIPKKKSPQTRVYALVLGDPLTNLPARFESRVAGCYFGIGMGSVLFQEIREFRSLAYSTSANVFS